MISLVPMLCIIAEDYRHLINPTHASRLLPPIQPQNKNGDLVRAWSAEERENDRRWIDFVLRPAPFHHMPGGEDRRKASFNARSLHEACSGGK